MSACAPGFKQNPHRHRAGREQRLAFRPARFPNLGDGLRAIFTLEGGITPLNGKSGPERSPVRAPGHRGPGGRRWGQLEFGRQANLASKYFSGPIDPFSGSFNLANMGTTFSATNTLRYDNLVLYQSPDWSGFQFGVGYRSTPTTPARGHGPEDGLRHRRQQRALTTGLRYANARSRWSPPMIASIRPMPRKAEIAHAHPGNHHRRRLRFRGREAGRCHRTDPRRLAARRDDGRVARHQGYRNADTFKLAHGFRADSYTVNATVPLGKSKLMMSWQMARPNGSALTGDDANTQVSAPPIPMTSPSAPTCTPMLPTRTISRSVAT